MRLLSERGELTGDGIGGSESIRIPEGVREVIGQRLNRLSERCNQVLTIASTLGRQFDFRVMCALISDAGEQELLAVIDEALDARLVYEVAGGVERYQFSHALVQQTLASELSSSRRVRLHAHIAEVLEELGGAEVEAHAVELAFHFVRAQPVLGTEKLVRYSLLAGEQALATYAWEDALDHFQRALQAKENQHVDSQSAAILNGLGQAYAALFQALEAWDCLRRSFDYYAEVGDVERAVAVAEYPIVLSPGDRVVTPVLERALSLVPSGSQRTARLLSRYGFALFWESGNYAKAEDAFRQALSLARRENDVRREIEILNTAANVDTLCLRWKQSLERSLRAVELALAVGDPQLEMPARHWAALVLMALGEVGKADSQVESLWSQARRSRNRVWLAWSYNDKAEVSRLRGAWWAAREFSDRSLEIIGWERHHSIARRALMEYEAGDVGQGGTYLEGLLDAARAAPPGPTQERSFVAMVIPAIARITGNSEYFNEAQAAAEAASSSTSLLYAMYTSIGLALMAVTRGDSMAALQQYEALQPHRGAMFPFGAMGVDRLLGLLAQVIGKLDDAINHYTDAVDFCQKAGYRPELAWTYHDCADAMLERNGPGDGDKAMSLIDEGLVIAQDLGMGPLRENLDALRATVGTLPDMPPQVPGGLTPREVEVLRLVASGKSNPEIAEQLVISINTVARHISNIFSKTDVANRAEAAVYASQHGLL